MTISANLAPYRDPATVSLSEPLRLASLFGIREKSPISELKLVDRVAQGLPVSAALALEPLLRRISPKALHAIVSEPTLRRAKASATGALTREPSERLYGVARVIDQAARVFRGDEEAVTRFLTRPNPVLEGRSPFAVATASLAGAILVVEVLRRAEAGVAV